MQQLDELEAKLENVLWLGGQQPGAADREEFDKLGGKVPVAETHPNSFSWYGMVSRFAPAVRDSWTGGAAAAKGGKQEALKKDSKADGKKKGKAKPAKEEEDDEMDLFGDDDPEEAAAAKEALKKAADAGTKKKKAPPVAKSLVILEVKPWGPDVDLDKLGKSLCTDIVQDGLFWKTEFKKEPVAFGVFKIVIGMTIEDEKVSVDSLIEKICEQFEEEVQSVDIAAFNKL